MLAALGILLALQAGADPDVFEKKIRPVLAERCYSCHSASSGKHKGGLVLDSREGLLKGGDSGPAAVPGDPGRSLFLRAVTYADELKMPPKGKLPASVVEDLGAWIRGGLPWPADAATQARVAAESVRPEESRSRLRRLRSARSSAAVWLRRSRSFSRAFPMIRSNSLGALGLYFARGTGDSLRM